MLDYVGVRSLVDLTCRVPSTTYGSPTSCPLRGNNPVLSPSCEPRYTDLSPVSNVGCLISSLGFGEKRRALVPGLPSSYHRTHPSRLIQTIGLPSDPDR